MTNVRSSSSAQRGNAGLAESEDSTLSPLAPASPPRKNDARAEIRSVLQILELAAEWSRAVYGRKHLYTGDVLLKRQEVADIENALVRALSLLDVEISTAERARLMAQTIADFTPGLVAVDPRDPEQLALLVPPQSAPAFKRRAARWNADRLIFSDDYDAL